MPPIAFEMEDLPEFEEPLAMYGVHQESATGLGATDDGWLIAAIVVYSAA